MIFNAEDRQDAWFHDASFDVCIVGAGPAGITLARALAKGGWTVGLFEGGAEDVATESQELYDGDIIGEEYPPLETVRLRFLGGSSNHWTGLCRALDAWDFEPRPSNPQSGWPITKADLDGYATETDAILDLPPPEVSAFLPPDISPFALQSFRFSPPTRFRDKFHEELAQSSRIKLYLNANLVSISLDDAHRSVSQLQFRSFHSEGTFAVKAKYFVVCLGGIENPRMLLNSQGGDGYAIGNRYDLVGRYFCEHLHFTVGQVLYQKRLRTRLFIGPTPELMDRTQTLNFGLRLKPSRSLPKSTLRGIVCSTSFTQELAAAIGAPVDCYPQLVPLRIASEQALNPDSRILLTDKMDRFGVRRVAMNWQLGQSDYRTMRLAATEWAQFMAKNGLGRVQLVDWVLDPRLPLPRLGQDWVQVGFHHMCTTRMSSDPKEGVVDATCRVHDTENLYLGGSSVFATAGASNPTYTIVQLALRLADHLTSRLS
jgi:choline dehydrogenase-like flavoprotein